MQNNLSSASNSLDVFLKLTQGKTPHLRDVSKLLTANDKATQTKILERTGVASASAPLKQTFIGICNEAQLAKVAVAAAAATAEHGTLIPGLHYRSSSLMNWSKEDYQKAVIPSVVLVAKPPAPSNAGIPNGGTEDSGSDRFDDSPLKRCGMAIEDLRLLLENHEIDYPKDLYDDDEDEDMTVMETIWEESEEPGEQNPTVNGS